MFVRGVYMLAKSIMVKFDMKLAVYSEERRHAQINIVFEQILLKEEEEEEGGEEDAA